MLGHRRFTTAILVATTAVVTPAAAVMAPAASAGSRKGHGASPATTPGADCQPFSSRPCLVPFPNNLFTRKDKSATTGLRVHLPQGAMPINTKGQRIGVA